MPAGMFGGYLVWTFFIPGTCEVAPGMAEVWGR